MQHPPVLLNRCGVKRKYRRAAHKRKYDRVPRLAEKAGLHHGGARSHNKKYNGYLFHRINENAKLHKNAKPQKTDKAG
jgi:hypothetical protein